MSILQLTPVNFQTIELVANPAKTFASSSSGLTGTIDLFADSSPSLKEIDGTYLEGTGSFGTAHGTSLEMYRQELVASSSTNIYASTLKYIDHYVHSQSASSPMSKKQEIIRFTPGVQFDKNFMRKRAVQQTLFPFYRSHFKTAQWNYTNYHCLNFVTGTGLPVSSVMIYPAGTGTLAGEDKNPLGPNNKFTFDFWVKPRTTVNRKNGYNPGTILHMSSCYAISLVTGSSLGLDAQPDGFRILLQLSASADIPPKNCTIAKKKVTKKNSSGDGGFLFASPDNSLKRDTWHHVCIRWGKTVNNGTGSFYIDGNNSGEFVIASSSVMQITQSTAVLSDPDALFVGNYYEGKNTGTSTIAKFFNPKAHRDEGVLEFSSLLNNNDPSGARFAHPLNAEVHDLKIYNTVRTNQQVLSASVSGSNLTPDLLFYVPPFFIKESRKRKILQTPFVTELGHSDDPFNIPLSFGVGGLSINLENYTRDFVTKQCPRLLNLTASEIQGQTKPLTTNDLLYASGSSVKRNLSILPCDNGKFYPNFSLLDSGTFSTNAAKKSPQSKFTDAYGNKNLTLISLKNMVTQSKYVSSLSDNRVDLGRFSRGTMVVKLEGPTPEDPSLPTGSILTVLQRQRDTSSNEVVFFDISNMFYGDRINPGTFILEDLAVTGTNGRMKFKLKDDGMGNLYRADCNPPHAAWASVGNILYEEGIVVVKTPNLPLFGKDSYRVQFEGERKIYTMEILIPAAKGLFNSSSSPGYKALKPSNYLSETSKKFTYLTGINLHDENLNIVARANLAQPVIKRDSDRIMFKLRLDF